MMPFGFDSRQSNYCTESVSSSSTATLPQCNLFPKAQADTVRYQHVLEWSEFILLRGAVTNPFRKLPQGHEQISLRQEEK
jgi:hypothetical protein